MGVSKYPHELRERAVRLARESDRSVSAVARDPGIHTEPLRVWVRQDEVDDGSRADRLTTVLVPVAEKPPRSLNESDNPQMISLMTH